jgi:hypothetical protein
MSAESSTSVCNMALARIGAKRINDYEDTSETKLEAVYCRLYYGQTAKALMRSHLWGFAKARVQLSQDTETPAFQWTYSYSLPNDCLRIRYVYDGSDQVGGKTYYSWEREGSHLLINESSVYLKYIRWVEEVPSWDPLFTEVMVLTLAKKLVIPLSQDIKMRADIDQDLKPLMHQVRALDRQESEQIGRAERKPWSLARYSDTA